ncbi:beta-mannanase [Nannochloropsis oceanica]
MTPIQLLWTEATPTLPLSGMNISDSTEASPLHCRRQWAIKRHILSLLVTAPLLLMLLLQDVTPPTKMHRLLLQQPQLNKDGGSEMTREIATDFVMRKGDQLLLHGAPFRFISFNVPNLHVVEDESWHRASLWEQEDALQTIARMGGQVVRTYPLSIVGGLNNGTYTHVLGKGLYNEALLCDLDQLLVVADRLNVRLIIPFIDHWEWWGGIPQFTKLYNASFGDFYRSSEVKKGFKDLVNHVIMRRNTLTGRLYRDDPAILAWESGNELDYVDMDEDRLSLPLPSRGEMDKWMSELAAYIKGLDPNHLIVDGRLLNDREVSKVQLEDPHIDLISDHFYPNAANITFEERLEHVVSFTKGHKPFMVGEFGLVTPELVDVLAKRVIAEPAVAGALLWSLRSHNVNGGFYWHHEYDNYWAYHYPGFTSNSTDCEKDIMVIMEKHAYAIQGLPVPSASVPTRPEMIEGSSTEALAWRGAVGAQFYELERQEVMEMQEETGGLPEKGAAGAPSLKISAGLRSGGKWVKVSDKLLDSTNPYIPFNDSTAQPGKTYRYRIYGVNDAGQSVASSPLMITASVAPASSPPSSSSPPPPSPSSPPSPSPPPPLPSPLHLPPPRDQVPPSLSTPAIVSFATFKPEQAPVSTHTSETTAAAAAALTRPTSLRPIPVSKEAPAP